MVSIGTAVKVGPRVNTRDGRAGRVSRLIRDPQSQRVTHFVVRTRSLFGRDLIVPVEWATEVGRESIFLSVGRNELNKLPVYRTDEEIAGDVEEALWEDELLRRLDLPVLRAEVRDGVVTLHGHVANGLHLTRAEEAARRARGVREVRSELVADDDLEVRVALALARDPRTRPYFIQVHASQGVVHLVGTLQGMIPSAETQTAAQEVAANVAGVRSAIGELLGLNAVVEPLPILPRVGLPVYAVDGELGRLEAVVMSRRSRRVTHLVVAGRFPLAEVGESTPGQGQARKYLVVPAPAVAHATDDAIVLHIDRATARRFPEYAGDDFIVPAPDWQSSFDYRREDVRLRAEAASTDLPTPPAIEAIAA